MLKLHPSIIFSIYLTTYICSTIIFSIYPINYDFSIIFVALILIILFFMKEKRVILIVVFIFIALLANDRVINFSINKGLPKGKDIIEVQVIDEPRVFGKSQSFSVDYNNQKISIVTNQFPGYEYGDLVEIAGELKPVNPENKFYGYQKANNIKATYYYPEIKLIKKNNNLRTELRMTLIKIRKNYEKIISRTLPEPQAGLMSGILLGSRADLSEDFSNLLSRVGIIHIVALSGYNITIIAAFMATIGGPFSKKYIFWLSVLGIWMFVFATGLSASVVRAAIMGTLLLLASKFGRKSSALISVLFASALMIFINPNILLYDIGFQLSFAAVCGILFLAPRLENLLKAKESYFGRLIIATFSAQVFTIPLISYYFERISIISLIANFFVLPFIPIVMLIGFISSSAGFVSIWLSEKLSIIVWVVLSYIIKISEFLGSLKIAEIEYSMSFLIIVAVYIVLFEIILIIKKKKKYENTKTS